MSTYELPLRHPEGLAPAGRRQHRSEAMSVTIDRTHPAWIAAFTVYLSQTPATPLVAIDAADDAYRHIWDRNVDEHRQRAERSAAVRQREAQAVETIARSVFGPDCVLQSTDRAQLTAVYYNYGESISAAIAAIKGERS